MNDRWKPNVTVAAMIERNGQFLLVEEQTRDGLRFNQPAGHLDPGESLLHAASREALEETAYEFTPESLLGIYQFKGGADDITYMRFCFTGSASGPVPGRTLDTGIVRAVWMNVDEIRATASRHRTPLVMRCIEDYLAGRRYPLNLIHHENEGR